MYVCNFSTLTVTSNPPISKAHMCVFSSYCFTSNTHFQVPCDKDRSDMLSMVLRFSRRIVIAPFWHQRPQVFLKDWCCHKPQAISFNGWQLSTYHFLVLFCFIACYMLQNKDHSTNIKSSYHKSFHIQERRKNIGTNLYKNYYIVVKKLEMRRPFAFSSF